MIAVDTNVLVRVLTRDDPEQAAVAAAAMREGTLWIPKTVLLETEWVLRHCYGFGPSAVNQAIRKVAGLVNADVEDSAQVVVALGWHARGMDFADALHLASAASTDRLVTFDRGFQQAAHQAGAAPGVEILA